MGAIMPDAPNAMTFWTNITGGRYSISEVDSARWDPALYYDPDPKAPHKSYSKIGGWVREWDWDPRARKLVLMPRVAEAMDDTQKWAVACTHRALTDYGYPSRPLDIDRVAVVLGNAMGGEWHYQTALRVNFAEIAEGLTEASSFHGLAPDVQRRLLADFGDVFAKRYPDISEDSMPGELSNCIAGRVANLSGFRGPNYVIDAAGASAMAATSSAVHGLVRGDLTRSSRAASTATWARPPSSSSGRSGRCQRPGPAPTPQTASLVEGHGTSTRVGDVVEHESMAEVFAGTGVEPGSIALGSVKSNIGHLKAGAGAAGIFKVIMSLHDKVLPPSLNFSRPNPNIDFSRSPFRVNTELRQWELPEAGIRRAGASAFGFGGTNFHTVAEEYAPERTDDHKVYAVHEIRSTPAMSPAPATTAPRGAAVVGAATPAGLAERLASLATDALGGPLPAAGPPSVEALTAQERIAIDYGSAEELADKAARAGKALATETDGSVGAAAWKLLRSKRDGHPFHLLTTFSHYARLPDILRASGRLVDEADAPNTVIDVYVWRPGQPADDAATEAAVADLVAPRLVSRPRSTGS